MARRDLSNTAMHTLEDVYAALLKAEQQLERVALTGGTDMTRQGIMLAAANARLTMSQARERIMATHPKARANVLTPRRRRT